MTGIIIGGLFVLLLIMGLAAVSKPSRARRQYNGRYSGNDSGTSMYLYDSGSGSSSSSGDAGGGWNGGGSGSSGGNDCGPGDSGSSYSSSDSGGWGGGGE